MVGGAHGCWPGSRFDSHTDAVQRQRHPCPAHPSGRRSCATHPAANMAVAVGVRRRLSHTDSAPGPGCCRIKRSGQERGRSSCDLTLAVQLVA